MAIIIKMYQNKWQIKIGEEIWQFKTLKELEENLKTILKIKDMYGRLYE